MAFQSVPETAEITFVYQQNVKNVVNTVHAVRSGGYTEAQITALATVMDLAAASELIPAMVADAAYLRVEVRGLENENDFLAFGATSADVGALTGPGLPNNVTLSIKRASTKTGRSARGRWYFVGLAASDLLGNENRVDETAVLAKIAAVEGIRTAILDGNWTPVIVSRFTGGSQRAEGKTFDWVSTVAVDGNVDSMRGRLG